MCWFTLVAFHCAKNMNTRATDLKADIEIISEAIAKVLKCMCM
jgi:hypothetical protein